MRDVLKRIIRMARRPSQTWIEEVIRNDFSAQGKKINIPKLRIEISKMKKCGEYESHLIMHGTQKQYENVYWADQKYDFWKLYDAILDCYYS